MAASFPKLSTGEVAQYPVSRIVRVGSVAVGFLDGSQQRYRTQRRMEQFEFQWRHLSNSDINLIINFHDTMKGSWKLNWDLEFNGVTYHNCAFESDSLVITEQPERPELYACSAVITQVLPPSPVTLPTLTDYPNPLIPGGIGFQRGYQMIQKFLTARNDLPLSSQRITAWLRQGTPYWAYVLPYPVITLPEIEALESHFLAAEAGYSTFGFTDPLEVLRPKCVYSQPQLVFRYVDAGVYSTTVSLEEVLGGPLTY